MTQLSDLTDAIVSWTANKTVESQVPGFIKLVESDLNRRLRTRHNTTSSLVALVANSDLHPLPADFLGAVQVSLDGKDMERLTLEQMDSGYQSCTGYSYAIVGNQIRITPRPTEKQQTIESDPLINIAVIYNKNLDYPSSGSWYPATIRAQLLASEGFSGNMYVRISRYERANPENPPTVSNVLMSSTGTGLYLYEAAFNMTDYIWEFQSWYTDTDTKNEVVSDIIKLDAIGENLDSFVLTNLGGGRQEVEVLLLPPLNLTYYNKMPALEDSNELAGTFGWSTFYDTFPDIYLYGCLAEAFKFILDAPRADTWKARYEEAVQELITQDKSDVFSGSTLRTRIG